MNEIHFKRFKDNPKDRVFGEIEEIILIAMHPHFIAREKPDMGDRLRGEDAIHIDRYEHTFWCKVYDGEKWEFAPFWNWEDFGQLIRCFKIINPIAGSYQKGYIS